MGLYKGPKLSELGNKMKRFRTLDDRIEMLYYEMMKAVEDCRYVIAGDIADQVRSMNEVFPLERAAEAYDHMMNGKARFRCVLTTGN